MARPTRNQLLTTLLLLNALMLGQPTHAGTALPLYEVQYRTKVSGVGITLTRSLTEEQGHYHLQQSGKAFLVKLKEESHFTVDGDQILGERFHYQLSGVTKRQREVHYDPSAGIIRSLRKKTWTEHPWAADVLDRLSQQEQMRLLLIQADEPPEHMILKVVDGPKIKPKRFELVEQATLDTAAGTLRTVQYRLVHDDPDERSSDTWLAVDHSFLMVRTEHEERGSKTVVEISQAVIDGMPLSADGASKN
jgi:hypothetical protein